VTGGEVERPTQSLSNEVERLIEEEGDEEVEE
jgi:hypothetical protein